MQKFEFLRQPLLGELPMSRREEEKKMPFIVATYVYASSQGQRTHSARTKISCIVSTSNHTFALYNLKGASVCRCMCACVMHSRFWHRKTILLKETKQTNGE